MYKPLADSTLHSMTKKEIIELLRIAEHNAEISQEWVAQQAENLKDWAPVVHGRWKLLHAGDWTSVCVCSVCGRRETVASSDMCNPEDRMSKIYPFCHCGAKMDGGADNG